MIKYGKYREISGKNVLHTSLSALSIRILRSKYSSGTQPHVPTARDHVSVNALAISQPATPLVA